jgi:hypothetical protein
VRDYVNDPTQRKELQAALLAARCDSVAVGEDALEVSHPFALDEREEVIELTFFLKAWQAARPGMRLELA